MITTAQVSMLSMDAAVSELERSRRSASGPCSSPPRRRRARPTTTATTGSRSGPRPSAPRRRGLPHRHRPNQLRQPGLGARTAHPRSRSAILNYTETTFSGQRATMKMVASGALDRHPELKVFISEGGATWVPFLGDRMNEGYRQHTMQVRPMLSKLPKEILYRRSTRRSSTTRSAVAACTTMGYQNVMWGSDYPHMEGTFGHTQKTLHELSTASIRLRRRASHRERSLSCSPRSAQRRSPDTPRRRAPASGHEPPGAARDPKSWRPAVIGLSTPEGASAANAVAPSFASSLAKTGAVTSRTCAAVSGPTSSRAERSSPARPAGRWR